MAKAKYNPDITLLDGKQWTPDTDMSKFSKP